MDEKNVVLYKNVKIGKNCKIGNFVVIGEPPQGKKDGELKTIIGDNSVIRANTIIYGGNNIGKNFQTGHFVLIRENNKIGNDVSVGSYSEIAFEVKVGNDVKIHSNCHIYERTVIENGVRFNPGVYVLNTKYPYRPGKKPDLAPVLIRENARIGARVTLMPGIKLGRWCLIGADSLVTKDVSEYSIVYGKPAQIKGDIRDLKDKEGNLLYPVK